MVFYNHRYYKVCSHPTAVGKPVPTNTGRLEGTSVWLGQKQLKCKLCFRRLVKSYVWFRWGWGKKSRSGNAGRRFRPGNKLKTVVACGGERAVAEDQGSGVKGEPGKTLNSGRG